MPTSSTPITRVLGMPRGGWISLNNGLMTSGTGRTARVVLPFSASCTFASSIAAPYFCLWSGSIISRRSLLAHSRSRFNRGLWSRRQGKTSYTANSLSLLHDAQLLPSKVTKRQQKSPTVPSRRYCSSQCRQTGKNCWRRLSSNNLHPRTSTLVEILKSL